ncbi:hypothetical protein J5N97_023162 [Dioscorea zingiberensis]|uniref:t-SNARE coiled-coil homology domain-containing protein n=1 Tax=Dioscorea zingiberensis TaxID=325984 RepID=A0A9D5CDF3_9LILI|nr:hypothetical protein J5N97_023162 [Dioscorea zingiberensis]
MGLKKSLKSYVKNFAIYDASLAHDWKGKMENILSWLAPMAHNMIQWQMERNFEQQQIVLRSNVLLLETLYFADREKTEAAICNLLVGLNYMCRTTDVDFWSCKIYSHVRVSDSKLLLVFDGVNINSLMVQSIPAAVGRDIHKEVVCAHPLHHCGKVFGRTAEKCTGEQEKIFKDFGATWAMNSRRDYRSHRAALFDGIEEGGIRASPYSSHEIDEHDNERAVDGLQDRVNILKRLTGDIHEEVEGHNRFLDRMGNDMDTSRGVLSGTMDRFKMVFETKSSRRMATLVASFLALFLFIYYLTK